ncbi:beta-N-acetylhexosaminidase [Arthrobacter sp. RIT-PI-e]|uniref:beta-N-acetylhexosaminidase n=1 Tax=Arthrobacter sp. RIT-PI-e TaxID=1681197 RepID=UPI000675D6BC|nr:beta-N-acetylhexosaminidase [Arthrobacter sp. RIT-PI-e]KNC19621.1 beta-N-acetylhexosaminidase [Arthrobacter sp. RIT-PI-e]
MLPLPTSTTPAPTGNPFLLTGTTAITAPESLTAVALLLQAALRPATGLELPLRTEGSICLEIDDALAEEGYRLVVDADSVRLTGGSAAGVFRSVQTLLQLLPADIHRRAAVEGASRAVAPVTIEDTPRFGWRGAMLDVVRHFLPKHDVLRFIDLMALHKLNTLHLHLTDDQGWRVEILRYPRLTEVGAWRRETQVGADPASPSDGRPHGGYYTQADIREIVAYAAARFITVVPEIETPGHAQAAIAAYPELGVSGEPMEVFTRWGINPTVLNAEDATVQFFRNVLEEVMDLFPAPFIGVGGDECPREQWKADPRTQERMAELGLKEEADIQSWFIGRLEETVTARGRRVFGWDEILEGDLSTDAVVASWRGMAGARAAIARGNDVVACPDDQVYLDYRQSEDPGEPIPVAIPLTVSDVYAFAPVPEGLTEAEERHVLGGQANIWTEHMDSPRTIDYFAFPRLCAVAEVLWSGPGGAYDDFADRLQDHLPRLDALGVEYRRESGPLPWQQRPGVPGRPASREEREAHIAELVATITS